jgi:hypothetical protein
MEYCKIEALKVRDTRAEDKLRDTIKMLNRTRAFGNPSHQSNAEYFKAKEKLEQGIFKNQYRAYFEDGTFHLLRLPEFNKIKKEMEDN